MRQSSKTGTLKITNPQSLELAGTIKSTSETFVGESDGRYALSTSASTTITNAQNLYPELWNRAPAGWKSAAPDLVVPAQGVAYSDEDYSLSVSLSSPPGDVSANNTNLIVKRRGNKLILQGWTEITSADWSLISGGNIQLVIGENFNRVGGLTTTLYVTSTTASGWNQEQSAIAWTGGVSGTGTTILLYTSDGSGDGAVDYNDLNSNMRIYWSGAELTIPALNDTLPIPYIHLYDSVAAGALGLPEATADVSGIVSTGTQTFAGHKTFTEITSTTYNNLPAAGASSSGVVKKAFFLAQGGAQQTITGTASALNLDPPLFNEGFSVSGANNETIAVNNAGVYKISAHVTFNFLGTTESVRIEIRAGGARRSTTTTGAPDGSAVVSAVSFTMVELNANDTIVINVIMSSGSATTLTSRNDYTQVIIERMNA